MIAGASELYNVPLLLQLTGELDERALARAWHQLQCRHPMLRATIADTAGELIVSVHPEPLAELTMHELGGLDPVEQRVARQRLIDSSGEQRFDLPVGPLGSATLIRLAPASYQLLLRWHHLIVDARTLDLLCRDLRALYLVAAGSAGGTWCADDTGGPAGGASYRAFAEAERQAAVGALSELAWWVDEVAGAASFAPTNPTGPQASADSRIQQLQLGKHLLAAVEHVARAHSTSVSTVLAAAWLLSLRAEFGVRPIVMMQLDTGPASFGETAGPFLDQIPLVAPRDTDGVDAAAFLQATISSWHRLVGHAGGIGSATVLAATGRGVDPDGVWFSDVGFSLTQQAQLVPDWGQITAEVVDPGAPAQAKAAIFLELERRTDGVHGELGYRTECLDPVAAARLAALFEQQVLRLISAGYGGG